MKLDCEGADYWSLEDEQLHLDFGMQGNRKSVIGKYNVMEASVLCIKEMKWEVKLEGNGRHPGLRDRTLATLTRMVVLERIERQSSEFDIWSTWMSQRKIGF